MDKNEGQIKVNDERKHKILYYGILGVIIILLVITVINLYQTNDQLLLKIEEQSSSISSYGMIDSLYRNSMKEYAKEIKHYVNGCDFIINDQTFTAQEIVKLFNELSFKSSRLEDSLNYYRQFEMISNTYLKNLDKSKPILDSLWVNSQLLKIARSRYGFKYDVTKTNNEIVFTPVFSKLDSALLLYPFFKDALSKDSIGDTWTVKTKVIKETIIAPPKNKKRKK